VDFLNGSNEILQLDRHTAPQHVRSSRRLAIGLRVSGYQWPLVCASSDTHGAVAHTNTLRCRFFLLFWPRFLDPCLFWHLGSAPPTTGSAATHPPPPLCTHTRVFSGHTRPVRRPNGNRTGVRPEAGGRRRRGAFWLTCKNFLRFGVHLVAAASFWDG
jgi:hypothetical protein